MSESPKKPAVRITFEGQPIEAQADDTVAAALLRAKVEVFSRGPKYHRPRGPFCLAGNCAQCHMRIDGEPNIPTCQTPVHDGQTVERQNVLGSGDLDILRAVDFLFPEGIDHHHLMTKHRLLNQATQLIARRLAGIGELPARRVAPTPAQRLSRPLVVVGAGPAGLAAALSAARSGTAPLLLEARDEVGGHVLEGYSDDAHVTTKLVHELVRELQKAGGEIVRHARAVGLYAEGGRRWLLAKVGRALWEIDLQQVVLATGGTERPIPFEGNDLPGVFGGRGLLRLVRRHGVTPGKRAVVVGSTPDAFVVARGLQEAGIEVAALLDPASMLQPLQDVPLRSGVHPVRAHGSGRVESLRVRDPAGAEHEITCDIVAATAALQPSYELAAQAGAKVEYRPEAGGFAVVLDERGESSVDWLHVAGHLAGEATPPIASGDLAGLAAAYALQPDEWKLEVALRKKIDDRKAAIDRAAR